MVAFVLLGIPTAIGWIRRREKSCGWLALAIVVLSVMAGSIFNDPPIQVFTEVVVLLIAPLLYVSFSPPAWLRREWRGSEEEGLRAFMEESLLSEDRDALTNRALDWAMRLSGGAAAALFDPSGKPRYSSGLATQRNHALGREMGRLPQSGHRDTLDVAESTVIVLPVSGLE